MRKAPALLCRLAAVLVTLTVSGCGDADLKTSGDGAEAAGGALDVPAAAPEVTDVAEGDPTNKTPGADEPAPAPEALPPDADDPPEGGGAEVALEDDGSDPEAGADEIALKSDECDRSRYNCKLPAARRDRNRIFNDATDSYDWPLRDGPRPALLNGAGGERGKVGRSYVRVNYGFRRVFDGAPYIYAFATPLNTDIVASGWVVESSLVHGPIRRMPTLRLTDPGQGDYEATWSVTGGTPENYPDWKVSADFNGPDRNATDYLRRPGDVVNLLYNLPGSGGVSLDTYPIGDDVTFKRSKGVRQLISPLYRRNTHTRLGELHFIYGHIGGRYGWIAREALTLRAGPEPEPEVAPEPAPESPPPAEAPPAPPPPACYVRCCDGSLQGPQPSESNAVCHDWSQGACDAHDHVLRSERDGQTVWERPRACWAKCRARDAYHDLEWVQEGCTEAARAWCGEAGRGGLEDAAWSQCQP
jgi:hypothetical protein